MGKTGLVSGSVAQVLGLCDHIALAPAEQTLELCPSAFVSLGMQNAKRRSCQSSHSTGNYRLILEYLESDLCLCRAAEEQLWEQSCIQE